MKTQTELKFDKIIKEGFHEILKPLGFKKKGNNFYLQLQDLGQIINIQKSAYGSKDSISFTINTGLFIPEYWLEVYNYHDKDIPAFPTEPECLIRKRIGALKNQKDTWYDLNQSTDENSIIIEMRENLNEFILPYFGTVKTKQDYLDLIDNEKLFIEPLAKLIIYSQHKQFDKAKIEYTKLLSEKWRHPSFIATIKEYGLKYGLD